MSLLFLLHVSMFIFLQKETKIKRRDYAVNRHLRCNDTLLEEETIKYNFYSQMKKQRHE